MRVLLAAACVLAIGLWFLPNTVDGRPLRLGELVVTDRESGTLLGIDPQSGERRLISGPGVGDGPLMTSPIGVAVSRAGEVYIVDGPSASVFHVDALTGNRRILSGPGVGAGPTFGGIDGIALRGENELFVGDRSNYVLWRVLTETGERVEHASVDGNPHDIAVLPTGEVLWLDWSASEIRQFPATRDRKAAFRRQQEHAVVVDNQSYDPFALLVMPSAFDVNATGAIYSLSDYGARPSVLHIDYADRHQSLVTGHGVGTGPALWNPQGLAVGRDNAIYVTDRMFGVYRVDPTTGDRVLISGPDVGGGVDFDELFGIAVVVPEPVTGSSLAIFAAFGALTRKRRRPAHTV